MAWKQSLLAVLATVACASALDMPQLVLPWGTWNATVCPEDDRIYMFKDVRFGAHPTRFGKPEFPDWVDTSIQDVRTTNCIQIDTGPLPRPPGGRDPVEAPPPGQNQTEDCLFLDIYIPQDAFAPGFQPFPVVDWIHGGGYAFGSKEAVPPLNSGVSILRATQYGTIFIVGNYRLGAFGWLAGHYMEGAGQPNAGLYDQALLLEWIHKYIGRINGDPKRVSAWGESAGAGSILHHLIREDGVKDPLFRTYAALSPAFQWSWDNSDGGELDTVYRTFSNLSGCGYEYDMHCLRKASVENVTQANQELFSHVKLTGLFPVGPSVDDKWITGIPAVAFDQGRYWKNINSTIISHVENEAEPFTPPVDNATQFDAFLDGFLPGDKLEPVRTAITAQYNCTQPPYNGNYTTCLQTVIQDAFFTCNTRDLHDAYPWEAYMMSYGFITSSLALHSVDLFALFMTNEQDIVNLLAPRLGLPLAKYYAAHLDTTIRVPYQNYFGSFSLWGNPNDMALPGMVNWPVAGSEGNELSNVMETYFAGFRLIDDPQNANDTCAFWLQMGEMIDGMGSTKAGAGGGNLAGSVFDAEGVGEL